MDLGVVSTPAMFRESRVSGKPAVIVTASHNEPEFNGLKLVIEGFGAGEGIMNALMSRRHSSGTPTSWPGPGAPLSRSAI